MTTDDVDLERRRFLLTATGIVGGIGAGFLAVPFISSWMPTAKAKALGAPVEVDISKMEYGQQLTIEWRGKPVWIIRRNADMLKRVEGHADSLRDPNCLVPQQPPYAKNEYRARENEKEYLVLVGVCTHLGCSPKFHPDAGDLGPRWPGGFYCPCHGSTFDLSGRVFKGVPAPINLEVPAYKFLTDNRIVIGIDEQNPNGV